MENDVSNVSMEEWPEVKQNKSKTLPCKYCGKSFKRNGVLFHELHCKGKREEKGGENREENVNRENQEQSSYGKGEENRLMKKEEKNQKGVNEVNMVEEFNTKKAQIEPKKEEKVEDQYQCGNCNATFSKRVKFCHECGSEFD